MNHPNYVSSLSPGLEVVGLHPGLLSGLAFTGANRPQSDALLAADDGILTAKEIGTLNLESARLVVLSACETGLGQAAGGEGLLGLQRAFQAAGAQNVVASLWKVDDQATAALMKIFYEELWQKNRPPLEALRNAQLAIYRNPDKIKTWAARGLGQKVDLADGGSRDPQPSGAGVARTDIRRWAAFVLSGYGR